jgi:hypothetical protein
VGWIDDKGKAFAMVVGLDIKVRYFARLLRFYYDPFNEKSPS